MNKASLLLVLGFIFGLDAKAQTTWCPAGAEWNYRWASMGDEGYANYRYIGDTVYYNRPCRQLQNINYSDQHGPIGFHHYDTLQGVNLYTYSSDDTVFFYYGMFSKWLPVYFFNAQTGDTLTIPNYAMHTNSDSTVGALVDSTGSITVNNIALRWYAYHIIDSVNWCNFSTKVVERLGVMDNDLIPFYHCITDDYYYNFCNYRDNSFASYPDGAVCHFVETGIDQISAGVSGMFKLSPNPAANSVTITINEGMLGSTATITNVTGSKMCDILLSTVNRELSTENFANGVYLVTLNGTGERKATRKLVISK